jgi:hypothetical protein
MAIGIKLPRRRGGAEENLKGEKKIETQRREDAKKKLLMIFSKAENSPAGGLEPKGIFSLPFASLRLCVEKLLRPLSSAPPRLRGRTSSGAARP